MNNTTHYAALLAKRHRAERRFRCYGIAALTFAACALLLLFASIAVPAWKGFHTPIIELDFPANIQAHDAQLALKAALYQQFPDVTNRREKRLLGQLLAPHASESVPLLQPAATVAIPLSHLATTALRTPPPPHLRKQHGWLSALLEKGKIHEQFNWQFFTAGDSRTPEKAGFFAAMLGSLYLMMICLIVTLPIGVAAAVYLEEFAPKGRITDIIEININNLAAIPSIMYGLLGLFIYLHLMGLPRSSAIAGGLTLSLMTLPIIIISTRLALKAVPDSIRQGALAIGASPLQVVMHHLLPQATAGIMTGTILGMARAIGETAPLLMNGMVAFIIAPPSSLTDPATAMPVQIYIWSSSPETLFMTKTACGIAVLIVILLCFNLSANMLRTRCERKYSV
jgi:phosphate transport system permease protein